MKVTTYGTRGSIPVAGAMFVRYGGNTTCVEVKSECLGANTALVIDAGSGLIPLTVGKDASGVKRVLLLFTHYHHDHTQGLLLSPWTYHKGVQMCLYGPEENGIGPKQMLDHVMRPPFHPVSKSEVSSHMSFKEIAHPSGMVFVIHPEGGLYLCELDEFEAADKEVNGQMKFQSGKSYSLKECLVIKMFRSNHPERTISYRLEERPSGKVFVFLTDHENMDLTSIGLRQHVRSADLLIMDSQYSRAEYERGKASFGHGTPDFCVGVALEGNVKHLGLTHHDPSSSDETVDAILQEALTEATRIGYHGQVSACRDFEVFELIF